MPCHEEPSISSLLLSARHGLAHPGFLIFCCLMATIGYGMLLNMESLSRNARYAACFLIAGGGICSGPIAIGFLSNNLAGHWKRAVGSAMQVSFAGFAGIIGSVMFLQGPFLPHRAPNGTEYGVGVGRDGHRYSRQRLEGKSEAGSRRARRAVGMAGESGEQLGG